MTTPIRILHLITKLELGGAQRNTLYTAEHLREYGYDVYLWYGPGGVLTPEAHQLPHHWCVPSLKRSLHPLYDTKALVQLVRQLRRISPQIIHTHSSKAGFLGRMAAKMAGIPVIIHSVHGFPFSPYQARWKQALFRNMERVAGKWTSHFIFVSNGDRETALQMSLCDQNHSLIHSGFPLKKYTPLPENRANLRRRFMIPPDAVVIGVVAPFKPQKALHHLIEIAHRVTGRANVVFVIAGDGELRPELEKDIRNRGLEPHFRLPGFLFDLPEVMDLFDVGVSTSLWEGLPQSLVQMRLKQIPLVVSRISGNDEVVRHEENGFLVDSGDFNTFSLRILQLVENKGMRLKMGIDPENFSHWDATHMVAEQAFLYRKLLRGIPPNHMQESKKQIVP